MTPTSCHSLLLLLLAGGTWAQVMQRRFTREVFSTLREAPQNYDPAVRPQPTQGGMATKVQIQLFFRDIDIDDVNMEANFDITFRMIWTDTRLAHDQGPGEAYVTVLDPSLLWLPDAFFKNAEVTQRVSIYPERFARIHADGRIVYSTRLTLHQSCPMNLGRFPHDLQRCVVRVASYGYKMSEVDFQFADEANVTIASDIHASRFLLEKTEIGTCHSKTATGRYSCLEVGMEIRRVFASYLLAWYCPTFFLVVVAWFAFLVPPDMFLGRLLLTLLPAITQASFSLRHNEQLASVPYVRAFDVFNGVSLTIIFFTVVYVIVCHVRSSRKAGENGEKTGSPEDGEGKPTREAGAESGLRLLVRRLVQRGEEVARNAIMATYIFFLFVYFVAYCGTG